ncbi:sensor histidine kinase [Kineosporia corallincola]|uniref:sensor histidine kinase n=1 Tax=Kineosporia corallincola TaxID=2835133 RepID=UPI003556BE63
MQWLVSAVVMLAALITVRPVGTSGWGLAVALLLPVNCLFLASRHLPGSMLPDRVAVIWLGAGVLAAAALMTASQEGSAYLFVYFLAGHAGMRLPARPALALAALASGLSTLVLLTGLGPGNHEVPWPVGLTFGLPVLLGMMNRLQRQAMASTLDAARSAERAAHAEARSTVLTERARIARDVHDVLAHSLAGVNMQLELADALLEAGDLDRAREVTGTAHGLVRESLRQAQWTVHTLREDALPLVGSLRAMVESSGHRQGLEVTGDERDLPAPVSQNLLRIAQEALTNATRYAPGASVRVTLDYRAGEVALSIVNGPPPRPPAAVPGGSGMGLIGMRERVALLKGGITAGPITEGADVGGWQVSAVVPA